MPLHRATESRSWERQSRPGRHRSAVSDAVKVRLPGPTRPTGGRRAVVRIKRVTLSNFRCFGPDPVSIELSQNITAFIGANGTGKTAVLQALSRLFGVTNDQRRVRRQDFHVPQGEDGSPTDQTFSIDVLLDFPELLESTEANGPVDATAIPEFFHQMAIDDHGNLKCRLRFDAIRTDDGSIEGTIESQFRAVRTLEDLFDEKDCSNITAADRARIQLVYVPSVRDGESQVSAFLRGRLWRAISWTDGFRKSVSDAGDSINVAFGEQRGVETVVTAIRDRWDGMMGGAVDVAPIFRPLDQRFEELIRRVEVLFSPGEIERPLRLAEIGDGHRSLLHIAITLATIDIEALVRSGKADGFIDNPPALPALTLLALEEPENNLAPFFLSRIMDELKRLTGDSRHAQALVSSHSASLLGRVSPDDVRHFRLTEPARRSVVNSIALPDGPEEESKFMREAVRSYPELYFARFVILGEGASEEIVIPRVAAALGFPIDRSFVAVVPLGGRHVNHFWRLLEGLQIPYATLLDLDAGRAGGGWGRIKYACAELLRRGVDAEALLCDDLEDGDTDAALSSMEGRELDESIHDWMNHLKRFDVYFASGLDLDMLMLESFPDEYRRLAAGQKGPQEGDTAAAEAAAAVLGAHGDATPYSEKTRALFPWYRYLFLGRSKPGTHLRVLSQIPNEPLRKNSPEVLTALVESVRGALGSASKEAAADAG